MKICPIALAVGCPKCVLFNACPAKEALGGYVPPPASGTPPQSSPKK